MAYQSIGRGASANDGTGDDLRTGAGKLNANFVEIYTLLGDGSTLTTDTVALLTATQTLTNKTLTAPTITGAGAIAGVFTGNITGDVTGNVTGDLTGNVTGNVTGAVDGIVGGTTPAAGSFTTASTSVHFQAAVHADTTARDAAITSPAAGMVAYLTATNKLQVYTGSAWETITSA